MNFSNFSKLFWVILNFFTQTQDADFGSCNWLIFLITIILRKSYDILTPELTTILRHDLR